MTTHILLDVRQAWRAIRLAKGRTALIVACIAIGIGANTALFRVVNGLLLRSVDVRDPGRLVRLRWVGPNDLITRHSEYGRRAVGPDGARENAAFSYPLYRQLASSSRSLDDLIACAPLGRVNVVAGGVAELARAFVSSGNYYRALGVRARAGRLIEPSDDMANAPAVAVLSQQYWQARFGGDTHIVGSVIKANEVPVTVVGIVDAGFTGVQQPFTEPPDIAFPIALTPQLRRERSDSHSGSFSSTSMENMRSSLNDVKNWWVEVLGTAKPGATPEQIAASLAPVFDHEVQTDLNAYLDRLSKADLKAGGRLRTNRPQLVVEPGSRGVYDADGDDVRSSLMLSGAFTLVLAVICTNVATLLVSRSIDRRREMSIRLALGATRSRVIRQLLMESLLTSSIGGLLGLLMGQWLQRVLPMALGAGAPIDGRVLLFAALLTLLTGIAFGLAPALTATRVPVSSTLSAVNRRIAGSHSGPTRILLSGQIGLSLVLLAAGALFLRTTWNLRRVDPGFDPRSLVLFSVNPGLNHYDQPKVRLLTERMVERLRALPGVGGADVIQPAPLAGSEEIEDVYFQGRAYASSDGGQQLWTAVVSPGFASTLGLRVVAGRPLAPSDTGGAPAVAVINEAAARRYFSGVNPLGQRFGDSQRDAGRVEIVGIVSDAKYGSLRDPSPPTAYRPIWQSDLSEITFVVRTAAASETVVAAIRNIVRGVDSNLPLLNVTTEIDQLRDRFAREQRLADALSGLAALALVLAAVGVFGVMSADVTRRTGEIGIRMALGASSGAVQLAVLGQSMRVVAAGLVLGLAAAVLMGRFVAAYLFGVSSTDPASLSAATTVLLGVTMLAAYLPARRASRVNPAVALTEE